MKTPHRTIGILIGLVSFLIITPSSQTQTDIFPTQTVRVRLQPIVRGILAAWDKFDVVCLGEDHASKNDSDLRITLVEHPDFIRKVNVVMVEFANNAHQDLLDRLSLDVEDIPREQVRQLWVGTPSTQLWDLPTYEARQCYLSARNSLGVRPVQRLNAR